MFLFGACLSQLTTDIGKYSIGRLRPHFLFVCNSTVDCNAPGMDPHRYIEDYECRNKDIHRIREARFVVLFLLLLIFYGNLKKQC